MPSPNALPKKKKWLRSVRSRAKVWNLRVVGEADKGRKISAQCVKRLLIGFTLNGTGERTSPPPGQLCIVELSFIEQLHGHLLLLLLGPQILNLNSTTATAISIDKFPDEGLCRAKRKEGRK